MKVFFFFFPELCTAQQKEEGSRSCFEEAQDSFGLEAKHKTASAKRRLTRSKREIKVQKRPTRARGNDGISTIAAKVSEKNYTFLYRKDFALKERKSSEI